MYIKLSNLGNHLQLLDLLLVHRASQYLVNQLSSINSISQMVNDFILVLQLFTVVFFLLGLLRLSFRFLRLLNFSCLNVLLNLLLRFEFILKQCLEFLGIFGVPLFLFHHALDIDLSVVLVILLKLPVWQHQFSLFHLLDVSLHLIISFFLHLLVFLVIYLVFNLHLGVVLDDFFLFLLLWFWVGLSFLFLFLFKVVFL